MIRRSEKKLDENDHVLRYDLERNNQEYPDFGNLIPGTDEWKKAHEMVQKYKIAYTAFCNMLRYSHSVANSCYEQGKDDVVTWEPLQEFGYKHTPNRTAELYEERQKQEANKK